MPNNKADYLKKSNNGKENTNFKHIINQLTYQFKKFT